MNSHSTYGLKKYLDEVDDHCIPQVHSTMLHITGNSVEVPLHEETLSGLKNLQVTSNLKYVMIHVYL